MNTRYEWLCSQDNVGLEYFVVTVSRHLLATMQLLLVRSFLIQFHHVRINALITDSHEINLILACRRRVVRLLVILHHSRMIPKKVTQIEQIAPELRIRFVGASGTSPGQ